MKELPSFIHDTTHTLQIIEEIIVPLDMKAMYNDMSDGLAMGASKEFLDGGRGTDPEIT